MRANISVKKDSSLLRDLVKISSSNDIRKNAKRINEVIKMRKKAVAYMQQINFLIDAELRKIELPCNQVDFVSELDKSVVGHLIKNDYGYTKIEFTLNQEKEEPGILSIVKN